MSKRYLLLSKKPMKNLSKSSDIYYFDNNSTTLIYEDDVKNEILEWMSCANPSNVLHELGENCKSKITTCRNAIALDLKVHPEEVFFTSGSTESNNMVIQGIIKKNISKKIKFTIISTLFEHPSVYNIMKQYEDNEYCQVILLSPCKKESSDSCGTILVSSLEEAIQNAKYPVKLVSIMYANNETGAINDMAKIGEICKKHKIFLHCDATQAIGKFIIHPKSLHLNSISFSGHKFHGPKGIGCLYINRSSKCEPILNFGGAQEQHIRPGTENVSGIAGLTKALEIAHHNREQKNKHMKQLRDYIEHNISKHINIEVLGCKKYRLPNTILCLIKDMGFCNKVLVRKLNEKKIYVSIGSACQSKKKRSHVLDTLNISEDDAVRIIRISLSDYTTKSECKYFVKNFIKIIKDMKQQS